MADVAFVPERDVLQRGEGVAAQDAREAGEPFAGDRVALVRHGAGTFLAFGKKFFGFQNFGALQMAELRRPTFDARADERECADELGVDVALDDLRGDRRRTQAELLANERFDLRREMRAGADRAGKFSDGDRLRARASKRSRARPNSSYISAIFRPNVVGSA